MQGPPVVLVAAILMVVAALTPSSGGWALVSSGGSTPADGASHADGGADAAACVRAARPPAGDEAAAAGVGGGAADGAGSTVGGEGAAACANAAILVTLRWNNNNDEDLHVVEPDGTEIAYYSPGPTSTGGRLDRDDEVGMCHTEDGTTGRENVTWAAWTHPAPGTYQVRVVEFNPCTEGLPAPAEWSLRIQIHGRVVQEHAGTTPGTTPRDTVAEFAFDYPGGQPDQAVTDDRPVAEPERQAHPIAMTQMTRICADQHQDPSARAEVREISGSPPSHWIRCLDTESEDVGGLNLDTYCRDTYPGTYAYNAGTGPRAYEEWECR